MAIRLTKKYSVICSSTSILCGLGYLVWRVNQTDQLSLKIVMQATVLVVVLRLHCCTVQTVRLVGSREKLLNEK
jgi:Tfp pilus assembly protein PilN